MQDPTALWKRNRTIHAASFFRLFFCGGKEKFRGEKDNAPSGLDMLPPPPSMVNDCIDQRPNPTTRREYPSRAHVNAVTRRERLDG
jgi:hypothetical protein